MKYYVDIRWDKRPVACSTWRNQHIKRDRRTLSDIAISKARSNWRLSTADNTTVYKRRVKTIVKLWQ